MTSDRLSQPKKLLHPYFIKNPHLLEGEIAARVDAYGKPMVNSKKDENGDEFELNDIVGSPFFYKLCLMNARISVFTNNSDMRNDEKKLKYPKLKTSKSTTV